MVYDYRAVPYDNRRFFGEFLRLDALPEGTFNANVDGSSSPAVFQIQPDLMLLPYIVIKRLIIRIEASGTLRADRYGDIAVSSGGVHTEYRKEGVTYDLDGGDLVTSNAAWAGKCYDSNDHTYGSGSNFVSVRWTFTHPIILRGEDYICAVISTDLTGLVSHTFMAQGWTQV